MKLTEDQKVAIEASLATCARGSYQSALLEGKQIWSGSDLEGRARSYGSRYAVSRRNLLTRIKSVYKADLILAKHPDHKNKIKQLQIATPFGVLFWPRDRDYPS